MGEVHIGKAVNACVYEGMSVRQAAFHSGVRVPLEIGRVVPGSTSGPLKNLFVSRGGD